MTLVAGFLLVLSDAVLLQRLEPRDRIAGLIIYAALPAVLAAVAASLLRARSHRLIAAAAAILPPFVVWATGRSTAADAFDRLTLAPYHFSLIWLPIAVAVSLLLRASRLRSRHDRPFGLPLWRFGLAFVLLFVAATFTQKHGNGVELSAFTGVTVFVVLLFGLSLLLAAAVPSRAQPAVPEWTALALAFLLIVATLAAAFHLADRIAEGDSIRADIAFSTQVIDEMEAAAARHDSRGTLTEADRKSIRTYREKREVDIARLYRELQQQPFRITSATLLFVAALVPALLCMALSISMFRARRTTSGRISEGLRVDRTATPSAPSTHA
ncbi:MAG: hypothetical protein ACYC60_09425 [Thermoanaerobaculia bacterium]